MSRDPTDSKSSCVPWPFVYSHRIQQAFPPTRLTYEKNLFAEPSCRKRLTFGFLVKHFLKAAQVLQNLLRKTAWNLLRTFFVKTTLWPKPAKYEAITFLMLVTMPCDNSGDSGDMSRVQGREVFLRMSSADAFSLYIYIALSIRLSPYIWLYICLTGFRKYVRQGSGLHKCFRNGLHNLFFFSNHGR